MHQGMARDFSYHNSFATLLWILATNGYAMALIGLFSVSEQLVEIIFWVLLGSSVLLNLAMLAARRTTSRRMAVGFCRVNVAIVVASYIITLVRVWPIIQPDLWLYLSQTGVALILVLLPLPGIVKRHRVRFSHRLSIARQLMLLLTIPLMYGLIAVKMSTYDPLLPLVRDYMDTVVDDLTVTANDYAEDVYAQHFRQRLTMIEPLFDQSLGNIDVWLEQWTEVGALSDCDLSSECQSLLYTPSTQGMYPWGERPEEPFSQFISIDYRPASQGRLMDSNASVSFNTIDEDDAGVFEDIIDSQPLTDGFVSRIDQAREDVLLWQQTFYDSRSEQAWRVVLQGEAINPLFDYQDNGEYRVLLAGDESKFDRPSAETVAINKQVTLKDGAIHLGPRMRRGYAIIEVPLTNLSGQAKVAFTSPAVREYWRYEADNSLGQWLLFSVSLLCWLAVIIYLYDNRSQEIAID